MNFNILRNITINLNLFYANIGKINEKKNKIFLRLLELQL